MSRYPEELCCSANVVLRILKAEVLTAKHPLSCLAPHEGVFIVLVLTMLNIKF